jgi:nucleoside-diphosphate-sugar epimerase
MDEIVLKKSFQVFHIMKIIITGGTGFLGSSLTKNLLEAGHEVHTIGRRPLISTSIQTEDSHHTFDLTKGILPNSLLRGTDIFFHVAAKAGVWGKYSEFYNANVLATENILSSCQSANIPRFIYTSTPSVVFSAQSINHGNESLPYGNTGFSPYAETKSIAEQKVLQANKFGEFQTLALRPHLVWGEHDPHLLPRVIKRHKKGKLRIIGQGQNKVDMTHIDNVTHAHVCAMNAMVKNKNLGGNPYFIGQGEPIILWEWLNEVFQLIGLPPIKQKLSFRNAFLLGSTLENIWNFLRIKKEPPMTRFIACQLAHDHWFSTHSAENDLGYRPIKNMKDALQESIPWLKSL